MLHFDLAREKHLIPVRLEEGQQFDCSFTLARVGRPLLRLEVAEVEFLVF
jgi:hypothetical protein